MNRRLIAPLIAFASLSISPALAQPTHALAMHGAPKYGLDFKHFDYVNPNAPKGGDVVQWAFGEFDSLNPFILKGRPAGFSRSSYNSARFSPCTSSIAGRSGIP